MEGTGQEPDAIAVEGGGVATRATERWKVRGLRVAGGTGLALAGPEVLRWVAIGVGAFDVLVREFVARPLRAMEGASD